jgi:hypothetical protein
MDEDLVGETPEVDAQSGREPHRDADSGDIRQTADDRLLAGAIEALVITRHVALLVIIHGGDGQSME